MLIGDAKLEDAVQTWGPHGLRVLPGGLVPPNPSELLASAAMTELLAAARSSYDVVVLDTSALLAVADGAVAASNADGVILLVRHGVTARDDVLRSVETLRAVNAPMLGAVLSMVPAGRSERRAARPGKAGPPAVLVDKSRPSAATGHPVVDRCDGHSERQRPSRRRPPARWPHRRQRHSRPRPERGQADRGRAPVEPPVEDLPTVVSPRVELADDEPDPARTGRHRFGADLRCVGRVRAAEGPRRAVIQLAAWLLVCLATAWLLRRRPVLLASLAVAALDPGAGHRRLPDHRARPPVRWARIRRPTWCCADCSSRF